MSPQYKHKNITVKKSNKNGEYYFSYSSNKKDNRVSSIKLYRNNKIIEIELDDLTKVIIQNPSKSLIRLHKAMGRDVEIACQRYEKRLIN